jgi:hypothetical protein
MALSAICKTAMLDGQPPILDWQKGDQWPYRLQQLLEAYQREDPTPRHAVAIPAVSVIFTDTESTPIKYPATPSGPAVRPPCT